MSINLPPTVRFVLYILGLIGGLAVALCVAEGWFDKAVSAFVLGVVAIINGLAAGNVQNVDYGHSNGLHGVKKD